MRFFRCNSKEKEYTFSIFRLVVSLLTIIIILVVDFNLISLIDHLTISTLLSIVCVLILVISVFCIYLSFGEMIYVYEYKEDGKTKQSLLLNSYLNYQEISFEEVISMLKSNPVLEVKMIYNNQIIKFGSCSDCKPSSSVFFDKAYFFEEKIYDNIEDISDKLRLHAENGMISILSIE